MLSLKEQILNPTYYQAELDKLNINLNGKGKLFQSLEDTTMFKALWFKSRRFIKEIIKEIKSKRFQCGECVAYRILIKGKEREFYRFQLVDRIIHGVIASILNDIFAFEFRAQLFSYRRSKSSYQAISSFSKYIREHNAKYIDVKRRGLYVLRQDIKDYTNSIPVAENAPVWRILSRRLGLNLNEEFDSYLWKLVKSVVRPVIISNTGARYSKLFGIPTGSPITALLYNICALDLDSACASVRDAFYARYSDDFIFAHENPMVVKEVKEKIDNILKTNDLRINECKSKALFFNGAARTSEAWNAASGADAISFLGARINFKGKTSLSKRRTRGILRALQRRIDRLGSNPEVITNVINSIYDLNTESGEIKDAIRFLQTFATDRKYLAQLDYYVERKIHEKISGRSGVKAFRGTGRRKMRSEWGLKSLVQVRNRYGT